MNCPICNSETVEHARAQLRGKFEAVFQKCTHCGHMFVPDPIWLAEAYSEPINRTDTGYVQRNLLARDMMRECIETHLDPNGVFLDYAAGYGLFVRLMRDCGYDFRWKDLYCQNLFCRGFEAPPPLTGPFEAITAFEVFEHLTNPVEELEKLSAITTRLIFSTKLLPQPAPQLKDWWYYGVEHGQHIAFYTRKSLELLGGRFGYNFATDGSDWHIFSRHKLSPNFFSLSSTRWRAFLAKRRRRKSLVMADHDLILKNDSEGGEAKAPRN